MATSTISCVDVISSDLPDVIQDLGSLSLTVDNQGVFTLSISLFANSTTDLSGDFDSFGGVDFYGFPVSDDREFYGYIESVSPQPGEGSDYIDYRIVAKGVVC